MRANLFAIPWALVGSALLALASVIYSRQRASRVAVLFSVLLILVAGWFAGFTVMLAATRESLAVMASRFAVASVGFLPAAIYDFTTTALRLAPARRRMVPGIWWIAAVFAVISLSTGLLINGVELHSWGYYPRPGILIGPFLIFFGGAIAAQILAFVHEIRSAEDIKRRHRLERMFAAFVIVYLAAIDFLPMFGGTLPPLGFIPVLAFIAVAWTTIQRHRLRHITAARATREIVDTMADALFVIDDEGRVRVINDAVHTLFGYTGAELLGRSIDRVEQTSGDATISRTLRDLARRGAIRDQERIFRHHDGSSIPVSVSISPVSDGDEERGAVVIARDIRERKHAEEELHSFMRRLEQSNRELEDFAYVASHDLQEPLRKIQAFGDLLKSKHGPSLPAQARDYVERMQSAAGRMQVLINDLLAFSRVTTKAQPFTRVDLTALAHEVAHDLELRMHDTGGKIEIEPLPMIEADPLQMRQLFQNLTGNALKFHRPGVPPEVRIRAERNHESMSLLVSDNGIGFEPRHADRIFGLFERLHGRGQYEGTGIGLAICRKIAERHNGTISATSIPGEGSTFTVTLPLHQNLSEGHGT
jgi:PAS domain S-box-containing protein